MDSRPIGHEAADHAQGERSGANEQASVGMQLGTRQVVGVGQVVG